MAYSKYIYVILVILLVVGFYILMTKGGIFMQQTIRNTDNIAIPNYKHSNFKEIYLAGGCFWGVEAYFNNMLGVEYTDVGYANGKTAETNYQKIKDTGHAEAVHLIYDPQVVKLEEILDYYFSIIDPTSLNKQGNDIGTQYRTGIYYVDQEDKEDIDKIIEKQREKYKEEIVTEVEPLGNYVLAEDYHQNYLDKNPNGYCHISLVDIPNQKPEINPKDYPKPSKEEIQEKLSQTHYNITQEEGTEPAFHNKYWDNKQKGIYVDSITGEPLFSSKDKYKSGSGWPSFTKPIDRKVVKFDKDNSLGTTRIEVKSRLGDTHLGHVFYDGPKEAGGQRFCMNSASLRFIPLEDMDKEGYGKFKVYVE